MPIAYFLLIVLSFIAARNHFPLSNIPVILGIFLMLADVIIQIIRLGRKKTHSTVLLSSVALLLISVGYTFVWLRWPGGMVNGLFGVVVGVIVLILWITKKQKKTIRFFILAFMTVVLGTFSFMKQSSLLCLRNNMDSNHPKGPVFLLHELAWYNYQEGDKVKAMNLLKEVQLNVNKKAAHFRNERDDDFYTRIFVEDSVIVSRSIEQVNNGNWFNYESLCTDDVNLDE